MSPVNCVLCGEGEDASVHLVARNREWRVVRVLDNPDHPAFWRVIWNHHSAEMTDLAPEQRSALMQMGCGKCGSSVHRANTCQCK